MSRLAALVYSQGHILAEILLENEVPAETYLTERGGWAGSISSIGDKKTKNEAARVKCHWKKFQKFRNISLIRPPETNYGPMEGFGP